MVPLLLVGGLAVQYGLVYGRGHHRWQRLAKRQSSTASHESLDRSPLEVCVINTYISIFKGRCTCVRCYVGGG